MNPQNVQTMPLMGPTGTPAGATAPVTPVAPVVNPAIVSSAPVWQDFNNATTNLNSVVNTPDPYMQLFQQQVQANALASENAIASASAATQRQQQQLEQSQNALQAGLSTAASKTGLAPNSAYQMQVLQGAQDQYNNRVMLLDQTEKLAIARAKAAQATGDVAVLREQLGYVEALRKEKAQAIENAQKMEWEKYQFNNLSAYQRASLAKTGSANIKKDMANDIAEAVLRFKDAIKTKGFYGADPEEYQFYRDYIQETYGSNAVMELDKQLEDAGIEVDYTGDNLGGNL